MKKLSSHHLYVSVTFTEWTRLFKALGTNLGPFLNKGKWYNDLCISYVYGWETFL